jgi:small conductance mechanosensitive channel
MNAFQLEGLTPDPPADTTAAADTTATLDQVGEVVDRITEVRSWSELWELVAHLQVGLFQFLGNLLIGFLVLVVFLVFYLIARAGLRRVFQRSRIEEDAVDLLLISLKFIVLGFGVIVALDQVGFNITGLLAGLGVAGLALGFAAKDTLANFIAGITILLDRPFRVGDRVEIDQEFGQVKKITLRSTRIHTNQNKVVIIPNANVVNNKIVNHTMQASLRLDVAFGIAYEADVSQAREVVLALTRGDERLRERPAPEMVVTDLADSAVMLALRIWLKNPHQEVPLDFEYRERIKRALEDAGIEIPYPHLSVFVEKLPEPEREPFAGEAEAGEPR